MKAKRVAHWRKWSLIWASIGTPAWVVGVLTIKPHEGWGLVLMLVAILACQGAFKNVGRIEGYEAAAGDDPD